MDGTPITFPGLGIEMNPPRVAFTILGKDFYWYGVKIAVGFLLAVLYVTRRSKEFGIKSDDLVDMLIYAVPTAMICARLYYVVFNFSLFRDNLPAVIRIWDGGIAIYGAVIGGVLAAYIFSRVRRINLPAILDISSLGLLIGQALGRWGNFVNREAYGAVTDAFLRMGIYVNENGVLRQIFVHPTFLYESLWNAAGFVFLHLFSKKLRRYDGQIFLMYLAWYGLGRGFIEGLRTDSLYLFGTGLRISQVLGFSSCLAALVFLALNRKLNKCKCS